MNQFSIRPPEGTLLYKYCPAETAKRILTNQKFRFSPIIEFNDPLELNTFPTASFTTFEFGHAIANNVLEIIHSGEEIKKSGPLQELIQHYRSGEIKEMSAEDFAMDLGVIFANKKFVKAPSEHSQVVRRRLAKLFGALCLSETNDNLLMWAHYSRHHTGAVIGIDPNLAGAAFSFIAPIRYLEKYPSMDDPFRAAATFLGRELEYDATDTVHQLFFSKSTEWSYEREWRAIANSNADIFSQEPDYSSLLIPLPSEALVSLHIGCRANSDDVHELVELARTTNPSMKILKSRPATDSYAIRFIEFHSEWPNEYPHPDSVL